jgi:cell division protein FtsZ
MDGAHGVLLSIYGGSDLGLFEINDAATLVAESAHPDANIIFGAVIDDTLGDEVKVTVIAAGFDSGQLPYKKVEIPATRREPEAQLATVSAAPAMNGSRPALTYAPSTGATAFNPSSAAAAPATSWSPTTTRRPVEPEEELDVPDFLK